MVKFFKSYFIFFSAFLMLIFFIFRSLLLNINSHLLDWLDYPLIVWIIFQNAAHLKSLQFDGIFNSNIFYPFEGSMLFSDLLLPQSLLALPLGLLTNNVILVFNVLFFLTLILNVISLTLFWKRFISNIYILFFAVLVTAFSPYFFLNVGHFQMISFWPMFFGMSFLFDKNFSYKKISITAVFCTLQLLTSVYLSVFMLFASGLWFILKSLYQIKNRQVLLVLIMKFVFFCFVFIILSSGFIYKYLQVKNAYGIIRPYGEYVLYSAHITDYVFDTNYHSLLSSVFPISKWDQYNLHTIGEAAGFPGIILLGLSIFGLFIYGVKKDRFTMTSYLGFNQIYFFILSVSGFIFSLGPRLNVNGFYTALPLPYILFLKLIPLFEPIRANARWSFFLYFGLTYFAVMALQKLEKRTRFKLIVVVICVLYIAELVPLNKLTEQKNYYPEVYNLVSTKCLNSKGVLLEYPLTQDSKEANIINNLTYKTQMMLASLHHNCKLVNGYTGYTPKDYERYENSIYTAVTEGNNKLFNDLLKQRNVTLFKLNKDYLFSEKVKNIERFLIAKNFVILLDNDQYIIAKKVY